MDTTTKLPEAITIMDDIAAINKEKKIIQSCEILLTTEQFDELDKFMEGGISQKLPSNEGVNDKPDLFLRQGIEFFATRP